ncbi:hypothetical protein ABEKA_2000 [Acinetobacter lwoffii]|nr:hypothetical protein ABEKA_2000 [Acinetobacter lwoffii]
MKFAEIGRNNHRCGALSKQKHGNDLGTAKLNHILWRYSGYLLL